MNVDATALSEGRISPNFRWTLQGRVIVIDNGGTLAGTNSFQSVMRLNSLAVITFDPANRFASQDELKELDEFQLVANATLGDGNPVTMNACMDPAASHTLRQTAGTDLNSDSLAPSKVIASYPISTVRLDSIEGLKTLDWLILDGLNNNLKILENGENTLQDTLLIQLDLPFAAGAVGENEPFRIHDVLTRLGFRLYCFNNIETKSNLPESLPLEKEVATELKNTDAIYIPNDDRLSKLDDSELQKLAFVLHTVYRCYDMVYRVLERINPDLAASYLMAEGYIWPIDEDEKAFTLTYEYCPDIWD